MLLIKLRSEVASLKHHRKKHGVFSSKQATVLLSTGDSVLPTGESVLPTGVAFVISIRKAFVLYSR
jgi:hypothetical protein